MKPGHKKYFDSYPKVDEFHFTTDGLAFTDKEKAEKHQEHLKKGKIETVKRNEKIEEPENSEKAEKKLSEMNREELLAFLSQTQQDFDKATKKKDKDALELRILEIEESIEKLK
jgi:hypothetical protein